VQPSQGDMMTVADYLKQVPSVQASVYSQSPAGPMRVIGVIARGRCLPFVRCVTSKGAIVEWAVLFSTSLEDEAAA